MPGFSPVSAAKAGDAERTRREAAVKRERMGEAEEDGRWKVEEGR
jgi:hypothetical protein